MFGNSLFRQFDNDPFFSDVHARHNEHMRRMDQMMGGGMFDPFFGGGAQQQSISDRRTDRHDRNHNAVDRSGANQMMMPFGGSMFGGFPNMFGAQRDMMQRMGQMQSDPNCHSYSSSTVMSYSNTGNGAPKMYHASSSTRTAPGGVKEVRKAVRDSESGMEKMAVGHHIHERGHVIEKSHNRRTGDQDEQQDFLNIGEDEVDTFNHEWKEKTSHFSDQAAIRDRSRRPHHDRRAIADSHHRSQHGYRDRGNRE